jgi:hypothetical protein
MKPRKSTVIVVLLTFLFAAFAIAMAQGTTQTDQKKKAESCCAEGAKCCAEDSCKHEANSCCKEGAECCKEGAECCKTDANKDHADCCGDSCEMKGKHDEKAKHDPKKHGECCKVKTKDGKDAKPKTKA